MICCLSVFEISSPHIFVLFSPHIFGTRSPFERCDLVGAKLNHRVTYREHTESSLDEKSVTRFLLRIIIRGGGNASMHLLESKSQQVHKLLSSFFLKLAIPCTYLFYKHMPRSFAPKQRRQFEIFRKGDGMADDRLI